MFLKEPELNFVEFTNNGNLPQGQYGSHSWMNAEVHAYPALRGDNYERFIDEHNQNFPLPSIRSDDVEMRSAPEIADRGREVFLPYQDNSIDIDNNTRNSISEHINDFMKYEIKYGLERQIQNSQDPSPYVDNCGNPEAYFGSDIVTNISQSCYDCQTDEALFNYDETERSCSSADITPHDDDEQMFEASDSDESYIHDSEDHPLPRGIHNPNYPGFQHLAYTLQDYPLDSPNSYENSIFSNVDIICPTQTDLARSPAIKKPNIFEEYNNNIENTDTIHENNDNDDIYDKSEAKSEILENIVNIRRSQVIKIPTISHARGRPQRSYEDDDADFPNGDLSPMSHVSHVSTDIFVYSDGAESRDINLNQENPKPASAYTETLNYPEESEVSDFEDDIIALQRDIYEEIQKPLANTIENISDVVNNVIKCIVEHQYAIEDDNLKQYTNTKSSNLYCRNQEKDKSENSDYESNISGNSSDSEGTPLETFSDNILNMDDAYMSNVKEDLFSSQSSESYTGSSTACEEEMSSSFEVFRSENSIPVEYDTDKNCNIHEPDSTLSVKTVDGVDIQSNNEHEVCPASQKKQEIDNRNSLPHLYSQKKQYISRKDDEKESDISGKPHKKKTASSAGFDVYNIETAMPLIDLDAIENHLRAAREEERRRRNDREEIRRRLAMGAELDDSYGFGDRPGRKPSLQARLQSGMNLQICFMNETASDAESPSETEMGEDCSPEGNSEIINDKCKELSSMNIDTNIPTFKLDETNNKKVNKAGLTRPSSLALNDAARPALISSLTTQAAFFECQARLQTEARMALAQAKEMAHMQMEIERQKQENSPITEMLRCSLLKAGVQLTGDRRRVSRQMLTDMNVAQLQVIVNELHTQIEFLNESLVKLLIARDELHMGQDSMLVDIEDLTRHLSAKEISSKSSGPSGDTPSPSGPLKSHLSTLTSLLSK